MIELADRVTTAQPPRGLAAVTAWSPGAPRSLRGPVVVVTTGGAADDHVVRTAARLATRAGQTVELLLMPLVATGRDSNAASPADAIAEAARKARASLVIVALDWLRHGGVDSGIALVRAIMESASVPVLAIAPGDSGAAHHNVVVGTDFGSSHIDAARLALAIADDLPRMRIVHVVPGLEAPVGAMPEWEQLYEGGATQLLAIARRLLEAPPSADVSTVLLHGRAAPVLTALAHTEGAQLIALGSHHYRNHNGGHEQRLILGSVAEAVLRDAPCSVLITPPPA